MKWLGKYGDARGGRRFLVLSAAAFLSFAGLGDGLRNAIDFGCHERQPKTGVMALVR